MTAASTGALPHVYRNGGSAHACVSACLARIEAQDPVTRAWVSIDAAGALALASELDAEAAAGRWRGPLHGLPVGVKDLYDVAGQRTLAGSAAREASAPAAADATLIARLRVAGAIVLGKTKTTEFAYLDPTDTVNPFDPRHTPGGSSSGSGAAVGAGMVPLALGTQTVGSVCRPAAYCGAAAFKPSTGSTPMTGVVPFASTYDTAGYFAPTLAVALDGWQAGMADVDAAATGTRPQAVTATTLRGLRFARPADAYFAQIDASIAETLAQLCDWLEAAGAVRVELSFGLAFDAMRGLQRTVMFHEAARAHRHLLDDARVFGQLGRHWREGLAVGAAATADEVARARATLADMATAMQRGSEGIDLLVLPAAASVAPTRDTTGDPGLILPWTIAGTPLTVLPVGLDNAGLPTAVMLAGAVADDTRHAARSLAVEQLIAQHGGGFRGPRLL